MLKHTVVKGQYQRMGAWRLGRGLRDGETKEVLKQIYTADLSVFMDDKALQDQNEFDSHIPDLEKMDYEGLVSKTECIITIIQSYGRSKCANEESCRSNPNKSLHLDKHHTVSTH